MKVTNNFVIVSYFESYLLCKIKANWIKTKVYVNINLKYNKYIKYALSI